jgi:cobalt-precorrin-5B (C1)-methyltransferase
MLGADPRLVDAVAGANTAKQAFDLAAEKGVDLGPDIANNAMEADYRLLQGSEVELDVLVVDRQGVVVGRAA